MYDCIVRRCFNYFGVCICLVGYLAKYFTYPLVRYRRGRYIPRHTIYDTARSRRIAVLDGPGPLTWTIHLLADPCLYIILHAGQFFPGRSPRSESTSTEWRFERQNDARNLCDSSFHPIRSICMLRSDDHQHAHGNCFYKGRVKSKHLYLGVLTLRCKNIAQKRSFMKEKSITVRLSNDIWVKLRGLLEVTSVKVVYEGGAILGVILIFVGVYVIAALIGDAVKLDSPGPKIIELVINTIYTSVFAVMTAVAYVLLRQRRDGVDVKELAAVFE